MKSTMKAIVIAAVIAVIAASVSGTAAYLTSTSSEIVNVFKADELGTVAVAETTGSEYTVVPGTVITKDPVVTLTRETADTEDDAAAYVFVEMTAAGWTTADHRTFTDNGLSFTVSSTWTFLQETEDGTYVYYVAVNSADFNAEVIANNSIEVSANLTASQIEAVSESAVLSFQPYAIQQAHFADAAEAWAVL